MLQYSPVVSYTSLFQQTLRKYFTRKWLTNSLQILFAAYGLMIYLFVKAYTMQILNITILFSGRLLNRQIQIQKRLVLWSASLLFNQTLSHYGEHFSASLNEFQICLYLYQRVMESFYDLIPTSNVSNNNYFQQTSFHHQQQVSIIRDRLTITFFIMYASISHILNIHKFRVQLVKIALC